MIVYYKRLKLNECVIKRSPYVKNKKRWNKINTKKIDSKVKTKAIEDLYWYSVTKEGI